MEISDVGIVITCYNKQDKILDALNSAISQTVIPCEIVIVNDGSTDESEQKIKKFISDNLEYNIKLINQANKGAPSAKNTGFTNCNANWIIPLDGDDWLCETFIYDTKRAAIANNCQVVYSDIEKHDGEKINMAFFPFELGRRNSICSTCLIAREVWRNCGKFDESMICGYEDWDFWIRAFFKTGALFCKAYGDCFFRYNNLLNEDSVSFLAQSNHDKIIHYMKSKYFDLPIFSVPRVSVIVPCYNQSHFLKRCIDSVSRQTEKSIEVIIVNDGSTDDIYQVVDEIRNNCQFNINFIDKENAGLSVARNVAIEAANAEWILPLDSDNQILEDNWLEICLNQGQHFNIDVVYTDLQFLSGNKLNSFIYNDHLCFENTLDACALIRKQVFREVGFYRERNQLEGYEDWDFWIKCLENEKNFKKVENFHILYDDMHEQRMSLGLQERNKFLFLREKIKSFHPYFFNIYSPSSRSFCNLTVVLSSFNQLKTLKLVLDSYCCQSELPSQLIINDDGSTDGTIEYLKTLNLPFSWSFITRNDKGYCLASGNNEAAKLATSKRILFTNADQLHSLDSFRSHCLLNNEIGAGIFKGIAMPHSQKVNLGLVRDWHTLKKFQEKYPSLKTNTYHASYLDPNKNPMGVWGGNFSINFEDFFNIGGYDEDFDVGWGGEETDLMMRAIKNGIEIKWVYDSEIFHLDHDIKQYAIEMKGTHRFMSKYGNV